MLILVHHTGRPACESVSNSADPFWIELFEVSAENGDCSTLCKVSKLSTVYISSFGVSPGTNWPFFWSISFNCHKKTTKLLQLIISQQNNQDERPRGAERPHFLWICYRADYDANVTGGDVESLECKHRWHTVGQIWVKYMAKDGWSMLTLWLC